MCSDCNHRTKTNRTGILIVVVLFVIAGVLSVLIARLNSLVNDAYDLSRQNHVIACHVDQQVSGGIKILQCRDVPDTLLHPGGK